jgi:hypothetical protein
VAIPAGTTVTVAFELRLPDLSYRLADGSLVWDPGRFTVFVGPDSVRTGSARFDLVG